jgi:hypothetical protein
MKVVCGWCEADGRPAIVREKEPLDDPDETHGLCPEHKALLGTTPGGAVASSERPSEND